MRAPTIPGPARKVGRQPVSRWVVRARMALDGVADMAGKPAEMLSRRDVARWLVSGRGAAEALPQLRRELMTREVPLSAGFWDSAEAVLARIGAGRATVGEVQTWLEATGSEPTKIIGLHVWEDEAERGPRADDLYHQLVEHLEQLVARGTIDPDRLLAGDPEALRHYVAVQEQWLEEPGIGPDNRADELFDEANEDLFAAWDEADAEALELLDEALTDIGERPRPPDELHAAAERLRAESTSTDPRHSLLARCGGLRPHALPVDDTELWLRLAAGVVAPVDEPPSSYQPEELSGWYTLMHADWLCAVGELARHGVGAPAGPDDLAGYVATSDLADGEIDPDDESVLADGFLVVTDLWRLLGAVDRDERLTRLGWWGLPEALRRAWADTEDAR